MAKWPKLSETLIRFRDLETCQACGTGPRSDTLIQRWLEHDDNDEPTPVAVILCRECADQLVEPHPRLYRRMEYQEPLPGAMPVCIDCNWRSDQRCLHSDLKSNGGPGLRLFFPKPTAMFVDGKDKHGRDRGWIHYTYHGPVKCDGLEVSTSG